MFVFAKSRFTIMSKIPKRPDPNAAFPNPNIPSLCYIKNVVKNPRIVVGDYTYYDDVDGARHCQRHRVRDERR